MMFEFSVAKKDCDVARMYIRADRPSLAARKYADEFMKGVEHALISVVYEEHEVEWVFNFDRRTNDLKLVSYKPAHTEGGK